jgi:hypothetical protein
MQNIAFAIVFFFHENFPICGGSEKICIIYATEVVYLIINKYLMIICFFSPSLSLCYYEILFRKR